MGRPPWPSPLSLHNQFVLFGQNPWGVSLSNSCSQSASAHLQRSVPARSCLCLKSHFMNQVVLAGTVFDLIYPTFSVPVRCLELFSSLLRQPPRPLVYSRSQVAGALCYFYLTNKHPDCPEVAGLMSAAQHTAHLDVG